MNITGKINLTKLVGVLTERKGQNGMVEGIFLPIEKNHFFKSDKGNVYLDISAWALKEPEEGKDTHIMKQSLPKEVYEAMSDEDKKAMPIIGNLKTWGSGEAREEEATVVEADDDLQF